MYTVLPGPAAVFKYLLWHGCHDSELQAYISTADCDVLHNTCAHAIMYNRWLETDWDAVAETIMPSC